MNEIINFGNGKRVKVVMMRGLQGEDGRGIVSIEKTSTLGRVDTYTITYTDGTTSTFEVTNGGGSGGAVDTVNGQTGNVVLDASDVGALPDTTTLADLTQDSTHRTVTDAQITDWTAKVGSVNGQTGNVQLSASDVGALPSDTTLAQLPQSSAYRTVSDAQISAWNDKADTNPNLVKNPFFSVNSLGFSATTVTDTDNKSLVDGWTFKSSTVTPRIWSLNTNGLTCNISDSTSYQDKWRETYLIQTFDDLSFLVGKTITMSVICNGELYSGTALIENASTTYTVKTANIGNTRYFDLRVYMATNSIGVVFSVNMDSYTGGSLDFTFKALKIEIGNKSTLLKDFVPNTYLEAIKCNGVHFSNRNLIDNAWFTVNQKGFTSGNLSTNNLNFIDRWFAFGTSGINGNISIDSNNNIIVADSTTSPDSRAHIRQIIECDVEKLRGKSLTLSIMFADGNIYKAVFTFPTNSGGGTSKTFSIENAELRLALFDEIKSGVHYAMVDCRLSKSITSVVSYSIKAMKLELGTESTLAFDVAPDHATELIRCQRYYRKLNLSDCIGMTSEFQTVSDTHYVNSIWDLPMRAIPTVSYTTGAVKGVLSVVGATTRTIITKSIVDISSDINGNLMITTDTSDTTNVFTPLNPVFVNATNIEFNAEL